MKNNHDPYLTTVQRSLKEERIKARREQVKFKNNKLKKKFFSQNIELRNFINLPEGLQKIVLFFLFIFIPYLIGTISIILAELNISSCEVGNIQSFLLSWTIGYELCASLILLLLIQQSFVYRNIDSIY